MLIDAPCTGTGSWRRNPDAKWRLRPGALESAPEGPGRRRSTARCRWSSRGGRIAYVTCSVLDEENGGQIRDFLARHGEFSVEKPEQVAQALGERGYLFRKAALVTDNWAADDPAPHRHRRVFREHFAAGRMTIWLDSRRLEHDFRNRIPLSESC